MDYLDLAAFKTTAAYEALSYKIKLALETLTLQKVRIPVETLPRLVWMDHPDIALDELIGMVVEDAARYYQ